jgi:3-methylcrotonyl-CoA carboxylase beta subunit
VKRADIALRDSREPAFSAEELDGIVPSGTRTQYDIRDIVARLVDASEFDEFKHLYGTTLVCGFAHIHGIPVGILGNNGILYSESALKATHFIELCNMRGVPLVFLQNITGFIVGRQYERAGIAKDGAKMVHAVANSVVPKFTVITGGSFGAGNYGMCGRAFDGRLLFTWPNHQIAVMGGEQAAGTLAEVKLRQLQRTGEPVDAAAISRVRTDTLKAYEEQTSALNSTSELWDDGILDPVDTRNALGIALSAALNAPAGPAGNGVFRF